MNNPQLITPQDVTALGRSFEALGKAFEGLYAPALDLVEPRADCYQIIFEQPHRAAQLSTMVQGIAVVSDTGQQRNVTLQMGLMYCPVEYFDSLRATKAFLELERAGALVCNAPGLHTPVSALPQSLVVTAVTLLWRSARTDAAFDVALRAYLPRLPGGDQRRCITDYLKDKAEATLYDEPPQAPPFNLPQGSSVGEHAAELGLNLSYGQRQV